MPAIIKDKWPKALEDEPLHTDDLPGSSSTTATSATAPDADAFLLRGVSKVYFQRGQRKEALREVSLRLKRGGIHGILGASGSGKTTLLRCLLRLERPDSGEIMIGGRDWTALSDKALRIERHHVGVVFQHLDLLSSRTVAANVSLPLEIAGHPRELRDAHVRELLEWFGIADKADAYPSQLSGGQRQRVALARALATSPFVLLADEPTSALDTETKISVLNILRRIRDDFGITILLITHDLQAAAQVCDTISLLDNGSIVETGPASDIMERPRSEAARRLFAAGQPPSSPQLFRFSYDSFDTGRKP